jgi:hypothetical protein
MTCISISPHHVSGYRHFALHVSGHLPDDGVEFRRSFELEKVTAICERNRLRPGCFREEPFGVIPIWCDLVESPPKVEISGLP